ncbi:MAG: DNA mismatch repair endonuclease MutL [Corallococcus sp.]|nr:DNA mismatch repair endonuclease MutL [Corallococcus sp.]MCM1359172.1 DNA mismatch repair endonuclease MutL [Corallococcus sp.]MCM1394562.1 DNA mismatch repair endonuclease MutL [Corallococcus sp.]
MSNNRINILSPEVYNKISAGEVVERPSSALKEIVENSVDAGARRIVIEVENGGFDLISVTDNGCGIFEDDLEAVFIKHATSKVETADDLGLVQTLGFRGEAMSSICAVSKVQLTTRRADSDVAIRVLAHNGEIIDKKYVTANFGTRVEVRDLFYNVPARKKFLKSPSRESTEISKYVSKLILTNPNLEMSYFLDGKLVFKTQGQGLGEAIFAVYGADCLSNCVPVQYTGEFLRISGFIGVPTYTKANTTYQTLSVNGRCIADKSIQSSIMQAYKPYLMQRQYPFYVLDLEIPCDMVDVNVHPRKSEVRFTNLHSVCGRFYHAVGETLRESSSVKVDEILNVSIAESPIVDDLNVENSAYGPITNATESGDILRKLYPVNGSYGAGQNLGGSQSEQQSFDDFANEMNCALSVETARKEMGLDRPDGVRGTTLPIENIVDVTDLAAASIASVDIGDLLISRTKILGTAFGTYLIFEIDDKIVFVDQHAAHERILFDKFMAQKDRSMQSMMFPYVFSVKGDEADFISANLENIARAGIEIEPFGINTFRICAVNTLLSDTKMDEFVNYLLASIEEFAVDENALAVEKIAKKACKAAVKAGEPLNETEIKYILKSIYENKVLQCPHGRPVTAVFTKTQLEKMFKRIV